MTHYGVLPPRGSPAGMPTAALKNGTGTEGKSSSGENKDGDADGSGEGIGSGASDAASADAAEATPGVANDARRSGLVQLFGSLGIAMRLKKIAHRIHGTLVELPHFSVLCQTGQTEAVRSAVESADVDEKSERGSTPLMHATWFGHTEVIEILLDKGANVNLQNLRGNTALHFAYENGHRGIVKVSRFWCCSALLLFCFVCRRFVRIIGECLCSQPVSFPNVLLNSCSERLVP
jgi:hypothetical protein